MRCRQRVWSQLNVFLPCVRCVEGCTLLSPRLPVWARRSSVLRWHSVLGCEHSLDGASLTTLFKAQHRLPPAMSSRSLRWPFSAVQRSLRIHVAHFSQYHHGPERRWLGTRPYASETSYPISDHTMCGISGQIMATAAHDRCSMLGLSY